MQNPSFLKKSKCEKIAYTQFLSHFRMSALQKVEKILFGNLQIRVALPMYKEKKNYILPDFQKENWFDDDKQPFFFGGGGRGEATG